MARILYALAGLGQPTGGHKVVVRHVEALVAHGLPAALLLPGHEAVPAWIADGAGVPVLDGKPAAEDTLVLPEDAPDLLRDYAGAPNRRLVFCQNHFYAAAVLHGRYTAAWPYRDFLACSRTAASWIERFLPHRSVTVIPAFADERRFAPGPKRRLIATSPRKRPMEHAAIRFMLSRLMPDMPRWAVLDGASERQVADAFASASVFLSLGRLEGLGMTPLEAMASGCVVAGFTGLGGREYASATNGFWAGEDDLEGCALALREAIRVADAGGPALEHRLAEGRRTAAAYSHARFEAALLAFWRAELAR